MLDARFHEDAPVLELTFTGRVGQAELIIAYDFFRDPRFTAAHQLMFDGARARIDFSVSDLDVIRDLESRARVRGESPRTAFVVSSGFARGVIGLARAVRDDWIADWKFFDRRADALQWLLAPGDARVDFARPAPRRAR